jgi:hypothetical protein
MKPRSQTLWAGGGSDPWSRAECGGIGQGGDRRIQAAATEEGENSWDKMKASVEETFDEMCVSTSAEVIELLSRVYWNSHPGRGESIQRVGNLEKWAEVRAAFTGVTFRGRCYEAPALRQEHPPPKD